MKKLYLFLTLSLLFTSAAAQLDAVEFEITEGIDNVDVKNAIEKNVAQFINSMNRAIIKGKKPSFHKSFITESGEKDALKMWKSSPMSCPSSSLKEKCLTMPGGGYQVRNIPVTVMNAPEKMRDQEIVLNFTAKGVIDNVVVAIDKNKYLDVIGANISVDDLARRQIIVDFVENFRTAYNRKDIDYLNTVYSDDALIITGKVIKVKQNSDEANRLLKEKVVYQKKSKAQYIQDLKKNFRRNKYIDIVFDSLEVMRHPRYDDIYGVNLKQYWNTSTYNDVGYLFLLIDFKDETQPCIQVRTWQPDKYDGKPIDRNEIFTLKSFNIKR